MERSGQPVALPTISCEEVEALVETLGTFPADRLLKVVEFVCRAEGIASVYGEELVIRLETLKPTTLRALQAYVQSWGCIRDSESTPPAPPAAMLFTRPGYLTPPPSPNTEPMSQEEKEALSLAIQSLPSGCFATEDHEISGD